MKRRTPGGVGLTLAVSAALVVGLTGEAVSAAPGARSIADGRAPGDGAVTVRVVNEVDADGTYDQGLEKGWLGVRVTLTDDRGTVVTQTTNSYGVAWFQPSASPLRGGRYRVQVYNPDPRTFQPAIAGLGDGPKVMRSNVGFVNVSGNRSTTYTTGFWEPGVYCQENPDLVTCNLTKGDAPDTHKGLVRFAGNLSDTHPGGTVRRLTNNQQQGSVFGIGNDRVGNTYMGTLVKRHAAYGPAGATNTIYRRNSASGVSTFVTLPGLLTEHDESDDWLRDNPVYGRVGREGIGDVDVSGNGRTLYAVSLNDSRLYTVPIRGTGDGVYPGTYRSHVIPEPEHCAGHWHPYGIGVRGGRVLVGGVCGAENTVTRNAPWGDPSQVTAHVYEFSQGSFRHLFRTAMNYPRGCAYRFTGLPATTARCTKPASVGRPLSAMWEAWNQRVPTPGHLSFVSAPQPILSNIEIADNGDLVLGFRDRFGDMQGTATYPFNARTNALVRAVAAGDVLRVCKSGTTYTPENNARCDALHGAQPNNDEGPGHGEFYADSTRLADAHEDQVTQGGTALQPFRNRLWSTVYDPFDHHPWEQGVRRWNTNKGTAEGNLTIQRTWSGDARQRALLFGKGNGLADLELICDRAPIQVGNRVWYDVDGDGVQDPSEPPVKGVKVTLDPMSPGPDLQGVHRRERRVLHRRRPGTAAEHHLPGLLRLQPRRHVRPAGPSEPLRPQVDGQKRRFEPCDRLRRRRAGPHHGPCRRPRPREPHGRRRPHPVGAADAREARQEEQQAAARRGVRAVAGHQRRPRPPARRAEEGPVRQRLRQLPHRPLLLRLAPARYVLPGGDGRPRGLPQAAAAGHRPVRPHPEERLERQRAVREAVQPAGRAVQGKEVLIP